MILCSWRRHKGNRGDDNESSDPLNGKNFDSVSLDSMKDPIMLSTAIPTPVVPVTPDEVSEICSQIVVATHCGDHKRCKELLGKIKVW